MNPYHSKEKDKKKQKKHKPKESKSPYAFLDENELNSYQHDKNIARENEQQEIINQNNNATKKEWFNFIEYRENANPRFENDYKKDDANPKKHFWGTTTFAFDLKNKKKVLYHQINDEIINIGKLSFYVE